ncbi:DUF3667 domain-containing protein [Janthinobacterium rivuli]|uniref:DUF3667 domain-containing protein n=1 Tax=Janthinobacterium rivuli TaxID=2751478 RepID=A0ABY8I125_9BURK|nr:DUF3667 domain-containing protein [Janthinobacterium rivuli]WFR77813.1 DUF3667 domain-containing protein [Janthinobacterium rivuli]
MSELKAVSALAMAGMPASEVEDDKAPQPASAAHVANCANCQAPLGGAFCQACGQSAHVHHSLLHLAEEVVHGILHFDAKGWKTIPLLVAFPGRLTRRYIDGQRKNYVSPLALFLFMVFLTFFATSFGGGKLLTRDANIASLTKHAASAKLKVERNELALEEARKADIGVAGVEKALAVSRKLYHEAEQRLLHVVSPEKATGEEALELTEPGWFDKTAARIASSPPNPNAMFPELEKSFHHAAENPELAFYKFKNTAYKFSFLLIPISLPFVWLMFFWKPGVAMYDHAVFVLYSLCFMSLLFTVLIPLAMLNQGWLIALLVCLAPPLHMFLQLRGTYNLGKWGALWRTCMLLLAANLVLGVFLVLVLMKSMH